MEQQRLTIVNKIVNETSYMRDGYYITISKEDPRFFKVTYVFGTKRTPKGEITREEKQIAEILIKDVQDGFDRFSNIEQLLSGMMGTLKSKGFPPKTVFVDEGIDKYYKEQELG